MAQILADILELPLYRLDNVESATSIAAATIAGVGVGVFDDFSVVNQFVKREKVFEPNSENREVYRKQKELFEMGYQCLKKYLSLIHISYSMNSLYTFSAVR